MLEQSHHAQLFRYLNCSPETDKLGHLAKVTHKNILTQHYLKVTHLIGTVMSVHCKNNERSFWPKQHLLPQDEWTRLLKVDRKNIYEKKIKEIIKSFGW